MRGVPTTHHEAVVDLNREVAGQVAGQDVGVEEANQELVKGLGTSRLPVEVWVDEENRVRRYALDVSVPMPETQPRGTLPGGTTGCARGW